jgi:hypothetical protein
MRKGWRNLEILEVNEDLSRIQGSQANACYRIEVEEGERITRRGHGRPF